MPTTNHMHMADDVEMTTPSTKLLPTEEEDSIIGRHRPKRSRLRLEIILHTILLSVSFTFFILSIQTRNAVQSGSLSTSVVDEKQSAIKQRFDGSFDRSSPFKGPPSAAVDKAWDDVLPLTVMRISEDTFGTLNASKHAVTLPEEAGGGRMALYEGFHLVHCVRTLWRATYPEYYLKNDEYYSRRLEEWRDHVDHCADMLRQKLMCDADPTVITYNWLKKHKSPHPNFNVQHKCRDWDLLVDTAEANRVDQKWIPKRGDFTEGSLVDFVKPPFDPNADA